ncbi:helix-turn-helix domain-containing protein [Salinactinospora qingdaonensis]|uniref:Helix-turn-helix domain-containing protein n=2 Tax=Salinactinospora qingdaonensis TaxID=702744 RepID=A0ABP7G7X4_9ACTN
MGLELESRPSESPYIERVWHSRSYDVAQMTSIAIPHCELVVWQQHGQVRVTVRGPETVAGSAPVPHDATFFGIVFSLGTSMPHLPVGQLVDDAVEIPDTTGRSLWLRGSVWHLPDYDNAEVFVARLVRAGVLVRDPLVAAVLDGAAPEVSERTVQRRFVAATGLTQGTVRQIDRARQAAALLREGAPIPDVVHGLGYFDQPHLARSLTRYIGRSATRVNDRNPAEPLSLLYKT